MQAEHLAQRVRLLTASLKQVEERDESMKKEIAVARRCAPRLQAANSLAARTAMHMHASDSYTCVASTARLRACLQRDVCDERGDEGHGASEAGARLPDRPPLPAPARAAAGSRAVLRASALPSRGAGCCRLVTCQCTLQYDFCHCSASPLPPQFSAAGLAARLPHI